MKLNGQKLKRLVNETYGFRDKSMNVNLFAYGIQVSQSTVYSWYRNENNPTLQKLLLICEKLGVTPNDLLIDD